VLRVNKTKQHPNPGRAKLTGKITSERQCVIIIIISQSTSYFTVKTRTNVRSNQVPKFCL
jgi:hypothetical protein